MARGGVKSTSHREQRAFWRAEISSLQGESLCLSCSKDFTTKGSVLAFLSFYENEGFLFCSVHFISQGLFHSYSALTCWIWEVVYSLSISFDVPTSERHHIRTDSPCMLSCMRSQGGNLICFFRGSWRVVLMRKEERLWLLATIGADWDRNHRLSPEVIVPLFILAVGPLGFLWE